MKNTKEKISIFIDTLIQWMSTEQCIRCVVRIQLHKVINIHYNIMYEALYISSVSIDRGIDNLFIFVFSIIVAMGGRRRRGTPS